MKLSITRLLAVAVGLLASSHANAQPISPPASSNGTTPASAPSSSAGAANEAVPDGGRFRFGINPTIGIESIALDNTTISGTMYGLDLRLGWQINHLLAVYAHPHLSFGSLSVDVGSTSLSGATGTFVTTVMAEATFIDRLFVGGGLGYGVLNNPSGLALEGRFGGYPLMGKNENGIRRKGLMVGGDVRAVFIDGGTGTLLMGCVGYEAF